MKKSRNIVSLLLFLLMMVTSAVCLAVEIKTISRDDMPKGIVPIERVAEIFEADRSLPEYKKDKSLTLKYGPLGIRNYAGTVAKIAKEPSPSGKWEVELGPYNPQSNTEVSFICTVSKEELNKFKLGQTVIVRSGLFPVELLSIFGGPFVAAFTKEQAIFIVDKGGSGMGFMPVGIGLLILAAGAGLYYYKSKNKVVLSKISVGDVVKQATGAVGKIKENVDVEQLRTKAEEIKKKAAEAVEKVKEHK